MAAFLFIRISVSIDFGVLILEQQHRVDSDRVMRSPRNFVRPLHTYSVEHGMDIGCTSRIGRRTARRC